jgi:hypothetical protein
MVAKGVCKSSAGDSRIRLAPWWKRIKARGWPKQDALDFAGDVGLLSPGRRVFQNPTTQKEGAGSQRIADQVERQFYRNRLTENDWINESLLNLPGQKQGDRAIVMLIVGVVMDQFMDAGANREDRGPLEHRCQE